jgi:single-strand DNA-binding protein
MTLPSITATGRLGSDPELKHTPAGKAVVSISIACDENRKNSRDEWEKLSTAWLRVPLWEDAAEAAAEHLRKGDLVTAIGVLTVREYDKTDGSGKGQSVEIKNATVSKHLPRASRGQGQQQPAATGGWGGQQPQTNVAADPWSTPPSHEEPPF